MKFLNETGELMTESLEEKLKEILDKWKEIQFLGNDRMVTIDEVVITKYDDFTLYKLDITYRIPGGISCGQYFWNLREESVIFQHEF